VGVRILILGGTGEARELAAELVAAGVDVLSSLAGRVRQPRLPDGPVRVGGFGGAAGLAAFLRAEKITAVIDATHPFAGTITANAAQAAAQVGVPLLVLRRPEWEAAQSWDLVPDIAAAAAAVRAWPGESVFLTTGRRDLDAFAADDRHRFLVRAVDPPDGPVPPRMTLVLDRGPYTIEGESALMRSHGVGLLVTKNSGGPMTAAKLEAARDLGVQILMVRRPPLPTGSAVVSTVAEAVQWISRTSLGRTPRRVRLSPVRAVPQTPPGAPMKHCCRPSDTNVSSLPLRAVEGRPDAGPSRTTVLTTSASHSLTAQAPSPSRHGGPSHRL
jgi:precorrin-6A/cobalt-precorrin-6A reductase